MPPKLQHSPRNSFEQGYEDGTYTTKSAYIGEQFEIEEVSEMCIKWNRPKFLVQWKGYDSSHDSWEPLKSFKHAPETLIAFRDRFPDIPDAIVDDPELEKEKEEKGEKELPRPKHKLPSLLQALKDNMSAKEFASQKFVIKRVFGMRFVDGKAEFCVEWEGYSKAYNTWEPVDGFKYAPDALRNFRDAFPAVEIPPLANNAEAPSVDEVQNADAETPMRGPKPKEAKTPRKNVEPKTPRKNVVAKTPLKKAQAGTADAAGEAPQNGAPKAPKLGGKAKAPRKAANNQECANQGTEKKLANEDVPVAAAEAQEEQGKHSKRVAKPKNIFTPGTTSKAKPALGRAVAPGPAGPKTPKRVQKPKTENTPRRTANKRAAASPARTAVKLTLMMEDEEEQDRRTASPERRTPEQTPQKPASPDMMDTSDDDMSFRSGFGVRRAALPNEYVLRRYFRNEGDEMEARELFGNEGLDNQGENEETAVPPPKTLANASTQTAKSASVDEETTSRKRKRGVNKQQDDYQHLKRMKSKISRMQKLFSEQLERIGLHIDDISDDEDEPPIYEIDREGVAHVWHSRIWETGEVEGANVNPSDVTESDDEEDRNEYGCESPESVENSYRNQMDQEAPEEITAMEDEVNEEVFGTLESAVVPQVATDEETEVDQQEEVEVDQQEGQHVEQQTSNSSQAVELSKRKTPRKQRSPRKTLEQAVMEETETHVSPRSHRLDYRVKKRKQVHNPETDTETSDSDDDFLKRIRIELEGQMTTKKDDAVLVADEKSNQQDLDHNDAALTEESADGGGENGADARSKSPDNQEQLTEVSGVVEDPEEFYDGNNDMDISVASDNDNEDVMQVRAEFECEMLDKNDETVPFNEEMSNQQGQAVKNAVPNDSGDAHGAEAGFESMVQVDIEEQLIQQASGPTEDPQEQYEYSSDKDISEQIGAEFKAAPNDQSDIGDDNVAETGIEAVVQKDNQVQLALETSSVTEDSEDQYDCNSDVDISKECHQQEAPRSFEQEMKDMEEKDPDNMEEQLEEVEEQTSPSDAPEDNIQRQVTDKNGADMNDDDEVSLQTDEPSDFMEDTEESWEDEVDVKYEEEESDEDNREEDTDTAINSHANDDDNDNVQIIGTWKPQPFELEDVEVPEGGWNFIKADLGHFEIPSHDSVLNAARRERNEEEYSDEGENPDSEADEQDEGNQVEDNSRNQEVEKEHPEFPHFRENRSPTPPIDEIMEDLEEMKSPTYTLKMELSWIAERPYGRGQCVFCGEHWASELCHAYPTYEKRLELVKKRKGCDVCGHADHKRTHNPKCNPSVVRCIFCDKFGHFMQMCTAFDANYVKNFRLKDYYK